MQHSISIPTGVLNITVAQTEQPLHALCGFAARNNSKRGFLFISKLLGKHWPVSAQRMQQMHEALARQIPASGPRLFIGMAETATGLGHGIFDACQRYAKSTASAQHSSASGDIYLQTTRYPVSDVSALDFQESHSHAADFHLYLPQDAALLQQVKSAQHLVLIDDELSTGNTLAALAKALLPQCTLLRHVTLVSLTDFSNGAAAARVAAALAGSSSPCEVASAALLEANFSFTPDTAFACAPAAPAAAPVACRRACFSGYSARFGIAATPQLPEHLLHDLAALPGRHCLVLGTGEFMHGAFLVARALERIGVAATLQATTRTPILLGADVVSAMQVPDLYGEGIANYLYNLDRSAYDQVLLVHETPRDAATAQLCQLLGARSLLLRTGEESLQ